ncbi:hypothetical protein BGX29_003831 [Mortierella sp. GBA35]|nr:hypothetical protein BGX23_000858 [Mortierella sp. AD031]KAF9107978.1 hypothetical protein BGX29_003831 [Mortierella sp. GBA35]KAG0218711.1 hypothetical protein BGX33_006274 [Mortierella sp. NVP41]
MKFAQLCVFLLILVIALATIVEAGSKKKSKSKKPKRRNPTQTVQWNKKRDGKSTWFNGHDLKGAACYGNLMGNSHVNAKDDWMIGAVHMNHYKGGDRTACFECAKITSKKGTIIVRIIDDCAGCAPNQIDLTAEAFKKLAPLDMGVVKTKYEFIRCPSRGNLKWPKSPKAKNH